MSSLLTNPYSGSSWFFMASQVPSFPTAYHLPCRLRSLLLLPLLGIRLSYLLCVLSSLSRKTTLNDMSQLYLSGYLLVLTYAKSSDSRSMLVIIHFTVSLAAPVCSVVRVVLLLPHLLPDRLRIYRSEQPSFRSTYSPCYAMVMNPSQQNP